MTELGQLYVIEFSTGVIKVGMSRNADRRLAQHKADAGRYFIEVADRWISDLHAGFRANERALIKWCCWKSTKGGSAGGEYFLGLDYGAAVAVAEGLLRGMPAPMPPPLIKRPAPDPGPVVMCMRIDEFARLAELRSESVKYLLRTDQIKSYKNAWGPRLIPEDELDRWIAGGRLIDDIYMPPYKPRSFAERQLSA